MVGRLEFYLKFQIDRYVNDLKSERGRTLFSNPRKYISRAEGIIDSNVRTT